MKQITEADERRQEENKKLMQEILQTGQDADTTHQRRMIEQEEKLLNDAETQRNKDEA